MSQNNDNNNQPFEGKMGHLINNNQIPFEEEMGHLIQQYTFLFGKSPVVDPIELEKSFENAKSLLVSKCSQCFIRTTKAGIELCSTCHRSNSRRSIQQLIKNEKEKEKLNKDLIESMQKFDKAKRQAEISAECLMKSMKQLDPNFLESNFNLCINLHDPNRQFFFYFF